MKMWKKRGKRNTAVLIMLIMTFSMAVPISSAASAEGLDDVYILDSTGGGEITDIVENAGVKVDEIIDIVDDPGVGVDKTLFTYDPQPETFADVQAAIDAYDAAYQAALADGGFFSALEVQKPCWEFEPDSRLISSGWHFDYLADEDTGAIYWTFFPVPVPMAGTITVTNWGELTDAVASAYDTIIISNNVTLEGVLEVSRSLNFQANSAVTLTAKSGYRHINVTGGDITLSFDGNVTLDGEYTAADGYVTCGGISSTATNLTLINAVIQNCNKHVSYDSWEGGGGGIFASSFLTLTDCKIKGNSTTTNDYLYTHGNGVHVYNENVNVTLTVSGGEISGNYYAGDEYYINFNEGGGIYLLGSTLTIDDGAKIDGNSAGAGGGIATNCQYVIIDGDASISGNNALSNNGGGGIYAPGGNVTLHDGKISGNFANFNPSAIGGGVFAPDGIVILVGGEISSNTAGADGGGIYASYVEINSKDVLIGGEDSPNIAENGSGGGVYCYGWVYMSSGEISYNQAGYDGGGIWCPSYVSITGGEISHNKAGRDGGGVHSSQIYMHSVGTDQRVIILNEVGQSGGEIILNEAGKNGGGVWCRYLHLTEGYINENEAGENGGGVYVGLDVLYGNEVHVGNKGYIQYNKAGQHGGGLYVAKENLDVPATFSVAAPFVIVDPDSSNIRIEGGSIDHNEAVAGNGGGIFTNVSAKMTDGVISYNSASAGNGGGIYVYNMYYYYSGMEFELNYDAVFQVISGDISYNRAKNGGGVYLTEPVEAEEEQEVEISDGVWDWIPVRVIYKVGMIAGLETPGDDKNSDVYITNNTATQNGGGIFTEAFAFYDLLTEDDYQNIETYSYVFYKNNKAEAAYEPPVVAASSYINFNYETTSIIDAASGDYVHPINNFDINYVGSTIIETYTTTYDSNGGTGSMTDTNSPYVSNTIVSVLDNAFTRGNYTFVGFKIQGDASGKVYASASDAIAGSADRFTITHNTVLVAQWKSKGGGGDGDSTTYAVTYNANGGTGSYRDMDISSESNYTILEQSDTGITWDGYTFTEWNAKADGSGKAFNPYDTITITYSMTLYAQWDKNTELGEKTYSVVYDPNGGTVTVWTVTESVGDTHTILANSNTTLGFTQSGYTFRGWSTNTNATSATYFGTGSEEIGQAAADGDTIILYAVWSKLLIPGGDGEKDINGKDIHDWDVPLGFLDLSNHFAYIMGYPDGTVQPQNNITRAEVSAIFFRLLTQESREEILSKTNSFPDVGSTDWYNNVVSTLVNGRIIKGYPDGTFRPNASITRAELATIAAKFATAEDISHATGMAAFSDIIGHWAEDYIALAGALGYVQGYGDGTFLPDEPITRAEVATLLNNVLNRHVESEYDLLDGMIIWPDNKPGAWYYFDIQEATNSHFFDRKEDGINEVWTELRLAPNWAAMEKPDSY